MVAFHRSHHVFTQLLLVPCLALGTGVESFEQAGSAWIGTLFPNLCGTITRTNSVPSLGVSAGQRATSRLGTAIPADRAG